MARVRVAAMSTPVTDPMGRPLTRPCPVCSRQIAIDAPFCPHCGTVLRDRGPSGPLIAAGVLAVIVGILIAVLLTQDDKTSSGSVTTIPTLTSTGPTGASGPTGSVVVPPVTTPPVTTTATAPTAATPPATSTAPTGATGPTGATATPPSG